MMTTSLDDLREALFPIMADKLPAVKARFEAEGVSIAAWAKANGFTVKTVYRVLDGDLKCTRGEAHRVAVALGLKKEPSKLRYRTGAAA
jgi:gp16 family phage-associated protein